METRPPYALNVEDTYPRGGDTTMEDRPTTDTDALNQDEASERAIMEQGHQQFLEHIRSHGNVVHALSPCTDGDCEIHNLEVALEEETIDATHVAYWIAGALAMRENLSNGFDQALDDSKELFQEVGIS